MRKSLKILIIVLLVPVASIFMLSLPWLLLFGFSIIEPNPPAPEITYGEFPFKLEYSVNDETFVLEDAVICEYSGVEWNEGVGKHRTWKESFKNSPKDELLIFTDGKVNIYCNVGSAEYYMDDLRYTLSEPHTPIFYHTYPNNFGFIDEQILTTEETLEKYNFKLINWEFSEPVENSFK